MSYKMLKLNLRIPVAKLLAAIPPKNREIIERRFGLIGGSAETLEAIGQSYHITRERVRQIQEYGFKKIMQSDKAASLEPVFEGIKDHVNSRGGVVKEADIFNDLARAQDFPQLALVLKLTPALIFSKENDDLYLRYAFEKETLYEADNLVAKSHDLLEKINAPISFEKLVMLADEEAHRANYDRFYDKSVIENVLGLSRRLKRGPFGDYGLAEWPTISPRGVRDKAHLVFEREKRPLHFREITTLIDKHFAIFSKRATHAQTVHNELIKDPRFVLIGRGLYGLAEWGYEPGTVKDVLVQVLKEQNHALSKEELFNFVAERRFVKPNTVFLNLQNKNYFKKVEGGKYHLA